MSLLNKKTIQDGRMVFGNHHSGREEIVTLVFRSLEENAIIKTTEEIYYKYV